MWTCPTCQRPFRNASQLHTCHLAEPEDFFQKRPPHLRSLYELILERVKTFGEFRLEAVKPDVVFFKTRSTFLAVKVKKDHLDVEFFLDCVEDAPPVSKFLQTSKNRVAHVVPVDCPEDLDGQLAEWMAASYRLIQPA